MTSKEAYRVLQKAWALRKDSEDYPDFDDINEALCTILQDLERKEQLEKENKELKAKLGFEKTLSSNQCLVVLKLSQENQELKSNIDSEVEFLSNELHEQKIKNIDLYRRYEKLKKAIEILKRDFYFEIQDNFLWIYDKYGGALETFSLNEEEIELLKEVLGE